MSTRILWGVVIAALFGLIILALGSGVGEPPAVANAPAETAPAAAETRADAVAEAAAHGSFILRGVRLFDGDRVWPEADVEVVAGRVRRVAEKLPDSDDVQTDIDGSGMTLLPGLIDSHVHTWGDARAEALVFGVTTVVDMFSLPDVLPHARQQRESVMPTREADLFGAGYLATVDGGHGTQYGLAVPTLEAPEQAVEWVAARKAEGSDFIKLVREDMTTYRDGGPQPSLDRATAAALIAAARAEGMQAVVHVSTLQHAMESLQDGAHGLVHVFHDVPADQAFVDLALDTGAFVIPTLTVIAGMANEPSGVLDDARLSPWIPAAAKGSLRARFGQQESGASGVTSARQSVARLNQAGVPILAGTDAPNPNTAHGISMHEELGQLVRAGLAPEAALASATSVPAAAFGLDDRGRIAPGLRADLLLVRGDPLTDIEATRDIVTIWKNGQPVERPRADTQNAPAAPVLQAGSFGDFDDASDTASGLDGWIPTTDQMAGGASEVQLERTAPGAADSAGALKISGEIATAGGQRWAGAMRSPGAAMMQPRNASALTELVLQVRGDGRTYAALVFSGEEMQAVPSVQTFTATGEWTELKLPLSGFTGADLSTLRAVAITATDPPGSFELEIDQLHLQ